MKDDEIFLLAAVSYLLALGYGLHSIFNGNVLRGVAYIALGGIFVYPITLRYMQKYTDEGADQKDDDPHN